MGLHDWWSKTKWALSSPSAPVRALETAALEPRLLLSAVAPVDAAGPQAEQVATIDDPAALVAELTSTQTSSSGEQRRELILIDRRLPEADELLALLDETATDREVLWIEQGNDLDAVTRAIQEASAADQFDAIHLISHGDTNGFAIGTDRVDTNSLTDLAAAFADWEDVFTDDGDFLIYGCRVAETSVGTALIGEIAHLTGADVAASDDYTGSANLGGDWVLETATGLIDSETIAAPDWNHVLATTSFQQGVNGYASATDGWLDENSPDSFDNTDKHIKVKLESGKTRQAVLRFEDLVGGGAGQIPAGATITSASLTLDIKSAVSGTISLHRLLSDIPDSSTWNTAVGGINTDDVEASSVADATFDGSNTGFVTISSLKDVIQAWIDNPATNFGWAITSDTSDELQIRSADHSTVSSRPVLTVDYTVSTNTIAVTTADLTIDGDTTSLSALIATPGGDGEISLFEAVQAANNTAGHDTITFDIGSGVQTISLPYSLGTLDNLTLDATTQPGYTNQPLIMIDGTSVSGAAMTLLDNANVRGLSIVNVGGDAISITGVNNTVQGNWIGVTNTGTAAGNAGAGIKIYSTGTANNVIGGVAGGLGNKIANNAGGGIDVASGTATVVRSNKIYNNSGVGNLVTGAFDSSSDWNDADTGPNNFLNEPKILAVIPDGTDYRVQVYVQGVPSTAVTVDLLAASNPDVRETIGTVAAADVTTNSNGFAVYEFSVSDSSLPAGTLAFSAQLTSTEGSSYLAQSVALPTAGVGSVATHAVHESTTNNPDFRGERRTSTRSIAVANDGKQYVVWTEDDGGGGSSVFGRLFAADGTALTAATVLSETAGTHHDASVDVDADGRFVVVWAEQNNNNGFFRLINADGTTDGGQTGTDGGFTTRGQFDVVKLPTGEFVIAFNSTFLGTTHLYAAVYDADGTFRSGIDQQLSEGTGVSPREATIAVNHLGVATIAWEQDDGIHLRQFDVLNNTPLGSDRLYGSGDDIAITALPDGRFFLAVADYSTSPDEQILGQFLAADGTDDGAQFRIDERPGATGAKNVVVASDVDGRVAIAYQNIGDQNVYYKVYDSSGNELVAETEIDSGLGDNVLGSIAFAPQTDTLWVTYQGDNSTFGETGVWKKAVAVPPAANTPPVADAGGPYTIQRGISVTLDGSGSSDADGDTITYAWDLDNNGIFGEAGEPTTVSPTISWGSLTSNGINLPGTYTITLQVDDGQGGVHTASTTLTVDGATAVHESTTGNPDFRGGSRTSTRAIAVADDGKHYVVWTEDDGGGSSVFGRLFASDGTALTLATQLNESAGTHHDVSVTVDSTGRYMVAWAELDSEDGYRRAILANGTPDSGEVKSSNAGVADQSEIDILAAPSGDYYLLTTSTVFGSTNLYMARLDFAGAVQGSQSTLTEGSGNTPRESDQALSAAGIITIAWVEDDGIHLRQFMTATNSALGNDTLYGTGDDVAITALPDARFFMAYTQGGDLYGQFLNADATLDGAAFVIDEQASAVMNPTLDSDDQGRIAISYVKADGSDAFYKVIDSANTTLVAETNMATNAAGNQAGGVVAFAPGTNTLWMVYEGDNNTVGETGIWKASVTVPSTTANNNPIADIGGPYTITKGNSVSLDASGSSDADGDTLTYNWDLDNDGQYDDATGETPTVAWATLQSLGLSTGTHTIGVQVDDGNGGVVTDTTTLTITNSLPVANAGGAYTIDEGGSVTLDASGSSDPNGDTLTYKWDLDNDGIFGEAGEPTTVGPTVSWSTLQSFGIDDDGSHTIGLQVDDGDGGIHTASATITVNNLPPTLSVTGTGAVVAGSSYTLNLSAIDPGDDTITSWIINWGDGEIDTIAGNPSTVSHTYALAGVSRNITVAAVDDDGTWHGSQMLVSSNGTNSVYRFGSTTGSFIEQFGIGDSTQPGAMAIGPDGNLYVASFGSDKVERYNPATGSHIDTFVAAGSGGLNTASGLAFGPDGNLYVSSTITDEVLRFDGSTGAFIDVFVTAGSGGLDGPIGMVFLSNGDLLVSGYHSDNVLRYDGSTGASLGEFVTAGSGGLNGAGGLAIGPDGNLYVASYSTSSILKYNGSTGASLGAFVASGSGGLSGASYLAFGPDGHLYVGSDGGNAVHRYNGTTGSFIDTYASGNGLTGASMPIFVPSHIVDVTTPNTAPIANAGGLYAVVVGGSFTLDASGSSDVNGDTLTYKWDLDNDGDFDEAGEPAGVNPTVSWSTLQAFGLDSVGTYTIALQVDDGNGGVHTATATLTVTAASPVHDSTTGNPDFRGHQRSSGRAIAVADDGKQYVVWTEDDGLGASVYGRLFDADGTALTGPTKLNETSGEHQDASVDVDASGRFVVVWVEKDSDSGKFRLINADGTTNGGVTTFYGAVLATQREADVVKLATGEFVITFHSVFLGNTEQYVSVYDANGVLQSGASADVITEGISDTPSEGALAVNDSGVATIAWVEDDGIHVRQYDVTSLSPIGSDTIVSSGTDVAVTALPDGRFFLAITDGNDIYGQFLKSNATAYGSAFVIDEQAGSVINPTVDSDSTGRIAIAYEDAGGTETWYKIIDASGATVISETTIPDSSTGNQKGGQVAFSGTSKLWLAYEGANGAESQGVWKRSVSLPAPVNLAPIADAGGPYSVSPGNDLSLDASVSTDFNGDSLTFAWDLDNDGQYDDATGESPTVAWSTLQALGLTSGSYTIGVEVSDGNGGTNTATTTLTVSNSAPVLSGPTTVSVDENTTNGTVLATFSATDPDAGHTVSFSMSGSGPFSLDTATGELTLAGVLDFEGTPSYTITIEAIDSYGASSSQVVTIGVNDVNEAPTLSGPTTLSIGDATATGTQIGSFVSSDQDASDTATWSIVESVPFTMTGGGGLVVNGALDANTTPSYTFTVRVTDSGGLTADQTVTVNITDSNSPPTITGPTTTSIDEWASIGTVLGTYSVSDPNVGDTVTLSIVGFVPFAINNTTGELTNTAVLDYEFWSTYTFTVRADDGNGGVTDLAVTVNVNDVNDYPWMFGTPVVGVAENATAGTVVTTYSSFDQDGDAVTYSVLESVPFSVNATTGELKVSGPIDFETQSSYTVTVRGTDTNGGFSDYVTTINVADINESPTLTGPTSASVAEDAGVGTYVATYSATDPDLGSSVSYSIVGSVPFAINSATGVVTVNGVLDFETTPSYSFTVRASDGVGGVSDLLVTYGITDANDAPVLTGPATINVPESTAVGVAIGTYSASDPDVGDTVTYSLLGSAPFAINSATGEVTLAASINFEAVSSYSFTVRASDGNGGVADKVVTINVTDNNDRPVANDDTVTVDEDGSITFDVRLNDTDEDGDALYTVVASGPSNGTVIRNADYTFTYTPDANFNGVDSFTYRVSDGTTTSTATVLITVTPVNDMPTLTGAVVGLDAFATNGTAVATAVGNDVDGDPLTYSIILGNTGGAFAINASGQITVADSTLLDPVTDPIWTLVVRASDGTASTTAMVRVVLDNNPPVAADDLATVNEDGSVTIDVIANDNDPDGAPLATALKTGAANGVVIHNGDGTFTYTPDANFNGVDSFTYEISDGLLTAEATVTITVSAVNDAPLVNFQRFDTAEHAPVGTVFGTVVANDIDGDSLTFTLLAGGDSALFTINASTGELAVADPGALDFETDPTRYIRVQVSDGTAVNNSLMLIRLIDINEAPEIAGPTTVSVSEAASVGSSVASFLATDVDTGDSITWSISGSPKFQINSTTGEITLAAGLDAEIRSSYTLTITATDANGLSDTKLLNVAVIDVNEQPSIAAQSFTIAENTTPSTIGTVIAGDPDAGDVLSYSLLTNPGGKFAINSATGQLSTTAPLNFEARNQYVLEVQVTDGSGLSSRALVTVNVTDVAEYPVLSDATFAISENAPVGSTAGILHGTDPNGATLSYSLVGQSVPGAFTIDPVTGTISVARPLDFESMPATQTLTVRATNPQRFSNPATITITLVDGNDRPDAGGNRSFAAPTGETLIVSAVDGLLRDAVDINGDLLSVVLITPPATGTLTVAADGSFTFDSDGTTPITRFDFAVTDGATTSQAVTVTITTPISVAPAPTTSGTQSGSSTSTSGSSGTGSGSSSTTTAEEAPATESETSSTRENTISTSSEGTPSAAAPVVDPGAPADNNSDKETVDILFGDPNDDDDIASMFGQLVAQSMLDGETNGTAASSDLGGVESDGGRSRSRNGIAGDLNGLNTRGYAGLNSAEMFTVSTLASHTPDAIRESLDNIKDDVAGSRVFGDAVGRAVGVAGSTAAVGYVIMALRSGALVTGLLAQMPAWRVFDPLVVLDSLNDEDDESLESMIDGHSSS